MKNILASSVMLFLAHGCFAQQATFEKKLRLDMCGQFASLWGNENKRLPFDIKSASSLTNNLWEQVLPKSTLDNDKIIINRSELDYFLKIDGVRIQPKSLPISNPAHAESRFGKQIQTIIFDKPLNILMIKKDKLVKATVKSLAGLEYRTFYPYGEFDVPDKGMVPIVYRQENLFEPGSPVLFATSAFVKQIDLEKVKVNKETIRFGSKDFPGIVYKTGIDFNNDGQNEILMYYEEVKDKVAAEGDESSDYNYSIIAMYFKDKWYRTSYWEDGQDGIEGF